MSQINSDIFLLPWVFMRGLTVILFFHVYTSLMYEVHVFKNIIFIKIN